MYENHDGLKVASAELIDFWNARDMCFCGAIYSPVRTENGTHHYKCELRDCGATWTAPVKEARNG